MRDIAKTRRRRYSDYFMQQRYVQFENPEDGKRYEISDKTDPPEHMIKIVSPAMVNDTYDSLREKGRRDTTRDSIS